jgi:hypothetical protein
MQLITIVMFVIRDVLLVLEHLILFANLAITSHTQLGQINVGQIIGYQHQVQQMVIIHVEILIMDYKLQ